MPANPKIVVRFDFPYHPAMAERFAREDDIDLRTCERAGTEIRMVRAQRGARLYDFVGERRAAAPVVRD